MAETSVGSISLGLEVKPKFDKDTQEQMRQLAQRVKEMFANLDTDMFKGLVQGFQDAMQEMTDAIKEQTEKSKQIMKSFISDMSNMRINISPDDIYPDETPTSKPKSQTSTSNRIRGSPSMVKMPKLKMDDIFEKEMMEQHISELESQMDRLDDKVLNLQEKRKMLLKTYSDGMNPKAENELNAKVMSLDNQIASLLDKMERLNIELKAFDRQKATNMDLPSSETSKSSNLMSGIKNKFSGMMSSLSSGKLGTIFQAAIKGAISFKNALNNVKEAVSKFVISVKSKINSLIEPFKKVTIGALKFGKATLSLVKMVGNPINTIKRGFDKLRGSVGDVSKSTKSCGSGLGRLIKSFTIFSMIFPLVSRGIMSLMTSLKDALMTNDQFSTSCKQIKTNMMAAFMPIYEAILPALNALMNAISKITAMFAGFISNLFGKTYSQSVQAAQGLNNAKNAMNGYGDAVKDTAKKLGSLGSMDEINVLSSNDNSGSGSGAGSANELIPTDFDEKPVSEFAKKIKDMFEKGDFTGIGKLIGKKINEGVLSLTKYISWDKIGSKISSAVKKITDLLNSLVETIDWENVGRLIGTGIDTISRTIYEFMTMMNWENIGKAFADGINGIFYSVDWDQLGATLGSYFQSSIDGLYGFVTNFDWSALGTSLANCIMGLVNSIDFDKFAETLGLGIMGAVSSVHNFVQNIDWGELGNKIASSINTFFSTVDFREISSTGSELVRSLYHAFIEAVANIDWMAVGAALADWICGIDYVGITIDLAHLLGEALLGIGELIIGFGLELGKNLIQGLWDGICGMLSDVGAWIKEHIVDPFINGIKSFFGIHSPSTVMADIGGDLIKGLYNGIGNLVGWLVDGIGSWFGGIGETIGNVWDSVKSTASDAWDGICGFLGDTWDGIKSTASDTWDSIKTGAANTWDNIKSGVSEKWSDIKSGIGGFIGGIKDNISNGFNSAKDAVTTTCSNIKDGVSQKFTETVSWLGGLPSKLYNTGKDMFSKMKDGVNGTIGTVKDAITTGMNKATSTLKNLSTDALTWGKDMVSGMASGIKNNASSIGDAVSNIANKISSWLHFSRPDEGPLHEYETWMPDMVEGLSKTLSVSSPKLVQSVKSMAHSMSDAMALETPDIAFAGHRDIDITNTVKQNDETVDKQDTIISYLGLILSELSKDKDIMCQLKVMLGDEKIKDMLVRLNKENLATTGKPLLAI